MDGYAAYGRVDRRRVGAAGPMGHVRVDRLPPSLGVIEVDDRASEASTAGRRLRDRLVAAREQWTITTFFLFDANSWR